METDIEIEGRALATEPAEGRETAPAAGTLAVVIPHYQRSAGLLRCALDSVFAQQDAGEIRVIVVDDESPVPAADEVATLSDPDRRRVRVVKRKNGGPAAARNVALDLVDRMVAEEGVEFVAFLDSDDRWMPNHLARARRALLAADVYVSNWIPLESPTDAYSHFKRFDPTQHQPLGPDLWRHTGDFFEQELFSPIGRLSTLVYRYRPFSEVRFDERLSFAFEDRLFRLDLATRGARVAVSTRPEALSGEGVNVFSGARWGTARRLDVARDELLATRLVRSRFALLERQRARLAATRRRERVDAFTTWLRLIRRERTGELARILRLLRVDPLWPLASIAALVQDALAQRSPSEPPSGPLLRRKTAVASVRAGR